MSFRSNIMKRKTGTLRVTIVQRNSIDLDEDFIVFQLWKGRSFEPEAVQAVLGCDPLSELLARTHDIFACNIVLIVPAPEGKTLPLCQGR